MPEHPSAPLFPFTVESTGGGRLAAWQSAPSGPPLLFVHGYPDTHALWDRVVRDLAPDHHCITYDVRGAGASDAPPHRDDYRLKELRGDLSAVIDAASPGRPVHLVAHDWGSLQAWDAVVREPSDPRLTGRIASLTSISGPCLHHIGSFRRSGRRRDVLRQGAHSWYIYAFHLPRLPELALRRYNEKLVREHRGAGRFFGPTLPDDSVNGLNLYRANIFHREPMPGPPTTALPVQVVVLTRDPYVTVAMVDHGAQFAPALTRVEIDTGHWAPRTHPHQLADYVRAFVSSPPSRREPS